MEEFGYPVETVELGQSLFDATVEAFVFNETEDDETSTASALFQSKKAELETTYSSHRKKAKGVFRKDALRSDKLKITGSLPKAYLSWLETVKKFYSTAIADSAIQAKLTVFKISLEDLNAAISLITEMETARSEYLRETGESQEATKAKDAALAALDEWMQEFYAIARIALEDKPQLLEALGLLVRS